MEFLCITLSEWADIAMVLLTFIAIAVSIFVYVHNLKNSKMSVRPHLTSHTHTHDTDERTIHHSFKLMNNGIGPAEIDEVKLFYNDILIAKNRHADIKAAFHKNIEPNIKNKLGDCFIRVNLHLFSSQYVMPAKETITILEIALKYNSVLNELNERILKDELSMLDLEIDYTSFYGEKFPFSTKENLITKKDTKNDTN